MFSRVDHIVYINKHHVECRLIQISLWIFGHIYIIYCLIHDISTPSVARTSVNNGDLPSANSKQDSPAFDAFSNFHFTAVRRGTF